MAFSGVAATQGVAPGGDGFGGPVGEFLVDFFLVASENKGHGELAAQDCIRRAFEFRAVVGQHAEFAVDIVVADRHADGAVRTHVRGVGVLGYLPQCDLLAAAGQQDRNAWLLHRGQETAGCVDRPLLPLELEWLTGEEPAHDGDGFVHAAQALGGRREGNAHLGEFWLHMADAEPEHQPAVGESVDIGGLPGEQVGRPVVDAIDRQAEPDGAR